MSQVGRIATRMAHIQPFYVMDLLARARRLEAAGRSVIHMEVGEPDFTTPEPIVRAGHAALAAGHTHYTPALGLPQLREAVAAYYQERQGIELSPERVLITPGSSGALQLAMGVLVSPGDEVLMADPGYPCNRHFVRLVDGVPVGLPVGPESAYQVTARQVEAAWTERSRALMVASPSNPTGTLLQDAELAELLRLTRTRGAVLIVDEIYHGLTYGREAQTALSHGDDLFVINSFSKYFGMTGWRLGWLVAPEAYVDAIDRLAQNIFLAPPTLSQHAALEAFSAETREILEVRHREFQARRDFLLPALRQLGFDIPVTPQGAFYLYANCAGLTTDSFRFAEELLEQAGVAVTPGLDFGDNAPQHHVRFAYTTSLDKLTEGVERIRSFLADSA